MISLLNLTSKFETVTNLLERTGQLPPYIHQATRQIICVTNSRRKTPYFLVTTLWAGRRVSLALPDGNMGDYLRGLERIKDKNFDIIRPTHGPAITEVTPFVQAYIDHRYAREDQILAALNLGITDIKDMVIEIYTGP